MKIGDRVFVRGYIDEIRKDTVIIRNAGGYFGTIPSEVITEELPSAQPERGKGRWLNINESEKWECSECSRIMWFSPRLGVKPSDYRFCPNCGADMRGEQDEL